MKNNFTNIKTMPKLRFIEKGNENSEVTLFLHPKIVSNWIWNNQINEFNQYHCFYLELPYETIETTSLIISEFIKKLSKKYGDSKINLVGIGLGGKIAIEILNKNPKIINKVFLSGINLKNGDKDFKIKDILTKTKEEYLDDKNEKFLPKAYLRYYGISKSYLDEMKNSLNSITHNEMYKIFDDSLNYKLPNNLEENLKNNNFNMENILIIYGTKEDLNTQKSAWNINKELKESKLIENEKGLLLWNITQKDKFNNTLKNFLNE